MKNPWGQVRALPRAKLVRRGEAICLAAPSMGTQTDIQHDYAVLVWELRQLGQYQDQMHQAGKTVDAHTVRRDFRGTYLVGDGTLAGFPGYATDDEIGHFLSRDDKPTAFAKALIENRWDLKASTVETYLKRS